MSSARSTQLHEQLEEFLVRLFCAGESETMDSLVDADLSFSQARLIFLLAAGGEARPIHDIAGRLGLSMAAAGRNVDQLVKLELVTRRESITDRRVKLVELSTAGDTLARQHFDVKRQALQTFVDRLPAGLGEQLSDALTPILAGEFLQKPQENCP